MLPNVGLDLIGSFISRFFDLYWIGRIIVVLVFASIFWGILALSAAVHGRLQLVAVPIAALALFSPILVWGFINFLFGLGLMLVAMAAWIRLERWPARQLAWGMFMSAILVIVHALPFGLWGLLLGTLEIGRLRERQARGARLMLAAAPRIARLLLVGLPGLVLFSLSATARAPGGPMSFTSRMQAHSDNGTLAHRLAAELVDRLELVLRVTDSLAPSVDRLVGPAFWMVIAAGLALGFLRLAPRLRPAILLALVLIVLCPPGLFGSGYVDDRMPLLLVALIAASLAVPAADRHSPALLIGLFGLAALNLGHVAIRYSRAGDLFREARQQMMTVALGEVTGVIHFSGTGRQQLAPLCAPLLVSLASMGRTAVPIFANETQQPLRLEGRLKLAVERLRDPAQARLKARDKSNLGTLDRQARIQDILELGFDQVFVCDAEGPVPGNATIERAIESQQWALYR